jgi:uncharacterized protein (TIGR02145 family)
MRKVSIVFFAVLISVNVFAQVPQKMSYQAVVRNAGNNLVINQAIGIRLSILQGSITGIEVFKEIYNPNPQTNANGLLTIEIGSGIPVIGVFANIDWSNGQYFIRTEIDPAGGTNYTITGISQLLSVPYALHAKTADALTETITESDPAYTSSAAANITSKDISNLSRLSGTNTGDQDLTLYATKDMGNKNIVNLANPINEKDAATKGYVDALGTIVNAKDAILMAYIDTLKSQLKALENKIFDDEFTGGKDTISDKAGNYYKIVKIGEQYWMAENLNYDAGNGSWMYQNNSSNAVTYGRLYTWEVAKNVCPTGWHLPSDEDWKTIETFLGMSSSDVNIVDTWRGTTEGDKLKSASGWNSSGNGSNDYAFSALPGGYCYADNNFDRIGASAYFWSSTGYSETHAYSRSLVDFLKTIYRGTSAKSNGFSVRCVRN